MAIMSVILIDLAKGAQIVYLHYLVNELIVMLLLSLVFAKKLLLAKKR